MISPTFMEFEKATSTYKTIPVVQRFFADHLTPIQIVHQLEEEVTYLLESKDEQSPWARYSFIGLKPMYELIEENGSYKTYDKNRTLLFEADRFQTAMERTLRELNVQPIDIPIPFRGGAVGYMSYDAIETIEPSLKSAKQPLLPHYQFLFCQTLIAYDHIDKELTIVVHVQPQGDAKKAYDEAVREIERITSLLERPANGMQLQEPLIASGDVSFENVRSNYEKEQFLQDVSTIQTYIEKGEILQAVLSQRFEMDVRVSALDIYRVLRMINPSPYMFYLKLRGFDVIGSSPERLVQVQDGYVEIIPIAGTRRRGKDQSEDEALEKELLADEKERREHEMLVDLAKEDIARIAEPGSIETPCSFQISKFSHVMHIISKVSGRLKKGVSPLEALIAAFPAGTVSGAPKRRAMEILQQMEPTRRGLYAGAISYIGFDGNIDACIAIRTLVKKDGKAYIQAGAGVVKESDPLKEYEETKNKAKALIRAVQIAEKIFYKEGKEEEVTHA